MVLNLIHDFFKNKIYRLWKCHVHEFDKQKKRSFYKIILFLEINTPIFATSTRDWITFERVSCCIICQTCDFLEWTFLIVIFNLACLPSSIGVDRSIRYCLYHKIITRKSFNNFDELNNLVGWRLEWANRALQLSADVPFERWRYAMNFWTI